MQITDDGRILVLESIEEIGEFGGAMTDLGLVANEDSWRHTVGQMKLIFFETTTPKERGRASYDLNKLPSASSQKLVDTLKDLGHLGGEVKVAERVSTAEATTTNGEVLVAVEDESSLPDSDELLAEAECESCGEHHKIFGQRRPTDENVRVTCTCGEAITFSIPAAEPAKG